jgi:hypothetical protein
MKAPNYRKRFSYLKAFALGFLIHAFVVIALYWNLAISMSRKDPMDEAAGWDLFNIIILAIIDYPLTILLDKGRLGIWWHCFLSVVAGGIGWGVIVVICAYFVRRLAGKQRETQIK